MLCPLGEYDANNARNPCADPKNNFQRGWEAKFCIDKSHYESASDQTERNSESSPIGLHAVRVGTFCQFTSSFLPSFNPPRHAAHSIADGQIGGKSPLHSLTLDLKQKKRPSLEESWDVSFEQPSPEDLLSA